MTKHGEVLRLHPPDMIKNVTRYPVFTSSMVGVKMNRLGIPGTNGKYHG